MKPSEVIAMRDKLADWLKSEGWSSPGMEYEVADALIHSGWVARGPGEEAGDGAKES